MQIYLVGGAVRDALLGLEVKERDWVVVGATPEAMQEKGFTAVGKDFPVFLHPETKEEYALARKERKVAGGYHGFTFDTSTHVTLEEDLSRRDLTINAMAKTPEGKIIDPYGGQQDLQQKLLRHVSPAFVEDPVRVLRVARFAARLGSFGFHVAPETLALMREMGEKGELNTLVPERVWKEMHRALTEETPALFLQVLRESKAIRFILPELDPLAVEKRLTQATINSDPRIRFAVMASTLGETVVSFCRRLRVPNEFQSLAQLVVRFRHQVQLPDPEVIVQLLEKSDAFRRPERFELFLEACSIIDLHVPKAALLHALLLAQSVDAAAIAKQTSPSLIKEALHTARVEAIQKG